MEILLSQDDNIINTESPKNPVPILTQDTHHSKTSLPLKHLAPRQNNTLLDLGNNVKNQK